MVEYQDHRLSLIFQALAHAARRGMLMRLQTGELAVTELARPLAMSLNAVSKHIKVLEAAGLVCRRSEGQYSYLSLNPAALAEVDRWTAHYRPYWESRLDALGDLLAQQADPPRSASPGHKEP